VHPRGDGKEVAVEKQEGDAREKKTQADSPISQSGADDAPTVEAELHQRHDAEQDGYDATNEGKGANHGENDAEQGNQAGTRRGIGTRRGGHFHWLQALRAEDTLPRKRAVQLETGATITGEGDWHGCIPCRASRENLQAF